MRDGIKAVLAVTVSIAFLLTSVGGISAPLAPKLPTNFPSLMPLPGERSGAPSASTGSGTFAFVSNFEDHSLDGWSSILGAAPRVVSSPGYSGEPSLASSARAGTQADYASQNIVAGEGNLSILVAIHAGPTGIGYFGLGTNAHAFVAVVGVDDGMVVAGASPTHVTMVGPVPNNTAEPSGWVLIIADFTYNGATSTMQVFVDSTSVAAATLNLSHARSYSGVLIETTQGTVHYSDVIATSLEMAIPIPGYNNMEGYGQGSALVVTRLPAFENYTATMTLKDWSVPQSGILSFQINAMNLTGTIHSTCHGFFQLGLSLDRGGRITPWYVPGTNCESHNFVRSVSTPDNSVLVLSIVRDTASHQIVFSINDTTIGTVWSTAIAYAGSPFYGAYTQMEFQPCCNSSPIQDYALSGELSHMMITLTGGTVEALPASYMLPFLLDAPPSWQLGYYQNATSAYNETST
jgi:hypothetical protein